MSVVLFVGIQAIVQYAAAAFFVLISSGVNAPKYPWGQPSIGDLVQVTTDREFNFTALGGIAAVLALQAIFLWPVRKPAGKSEGRWSVRLSLAVAGLCISVLLAGAILTAVWIVDLIWPGTITRTTEGIGRVVTGDQDPQSTGEFVMLGALAVVGLVAWAIATPLLIAFAKRSRKESALSRIASRLFLGTTIEIVAILPIDYMVRKRTDCYCAAGTFWALILAGTVGLFACGPAIVLPLLAKRRKRWYEGRCDACGYDLSGTPRVERCPECGAGWTPTPASQGSPPPASPDSDTDSSRSIGIGSQEN